MEKRDLEILAEKMIKEGNDFDEIVLVLKKNCTDNILVGQITANLSPVIAYYEIEQNKRYGYKIYLVFSIIVFLIGLFYTSYSYFKAYNSFLLAYGAIISGLWGAANYWKKLKSPIKPYNKPIVEPAYFKRKF